MRNSLSSRLLLTVATLFDPTAAFAQTESSAAQVAPQTGGGESAETPVGGERVERGALVSTQPPLTPMPDFEIGGGRPLTLHSVLESVDAHHPVLDAARAEVRGAQGQHLAAEGGFDPRLDGDGFVAPLGYYRYGRGDIELSQATPFWGTQFYAGYRIGRGMDDAYIPDYYGEYETLEGGELRLGAIIPVWRDGPIDPRRAAIARTELGLRASNRNLEAERLALQLSAAQAYYSWAAAGLEARIALALLALAEDRDVQIGSRVAAGAIPAIEHLENRRAVFMRRRQTIMARRGLEQSAIRLSYFLRQDSGAPRVPSHRAAPTAIALEPVGLELDEVSLVERALQQRPELARFQNELESARVRVELAENQLAPRFNVGVQGEFDVGYGTEDESERLRPPVFEAWMHFSVPIGFRESRGQLESARAALAEITARQAAAADQIRIAVQDALSALRAAEESYAYAEQAAIAAEAVAAGERSRFQQGAVSLLIVNLREAAAASARVEVVRALADLATARVALRIAVGEIGLSVGQAGVSLGAGVSGGEAGGVGG